MATAPPQTKHSKAAGLDRTLRRLSSRLVAARAASERFVVWRTAIFVVGCGVALAGELLGFPAPGYALAVLFGVAFAELARRHGGLKGKIGQLRNWIRIKTEHRARISLDWSQLPAGADYGLPSNHPFARDLDLIGPYSLTRLIDTTVTAHGRRWLSDRLFGSSNNPETVADWQAIVRELAPRALLRDHLILAGSNPKGEPLDTDGLEAQLRAEPADSVRLRLLLTVGSVLTLSTFYLLVLEFGFGGPRLWTFSLAAHVIFYFLNAGRLAPIFGRAIDLGDRLERLTLLSSCLEGRRDLSAPALTRIAAPFQVSGRRPSDALRRVRRIVAGLSVRAHFLVHLGLNVAGPWDFYFAHRYETERRAISGAISDWLSALGRIEAASALALLADLNAGYSFPVFRPRGEIAMEATGLGHPLIGHERRVANDFSIRGAGAVALLTGSNMSGKSTFLRTIGVNLCLAQAGGPVCAETFSAGIFRVYCSVRIEDRLEEGLSYFYAEVKRLKQILDAAADKAADPVLFLIDEIFKGTNNRERVQGSLYCLRALTAQHGLGIVSTHDLELTRLADENPKITNYHFQESVTNRELVFDYRLRTGPCTTTNALRIMALEGLPVPPAEL